MFISGRKDMDVKIDIFKLSYFRVARQGDEETNDRARLSGKKKEKRESVSPHSRRSNLSF